MSDRIYEPTNLTWTQSLKRVTTLRGYVPSGQYITTTDMNRVKSFAFNVVKGLQGINWSTDDIRAMIVTTDPNQDARFLDDSSIVELTNTITTNYSRILLTNRSLVVNDVDDRVELLSDDLNFNSLESGETLDGLIIFKQNTDDTDSIPLFYLQIPYAQRQTTGYPLFISNTANRGHIVYIY